ncbi:MAG: hypothetical protein HN981_03395 [Candidatus Pacebacteria bacterium]|jgi:hypothetical protein|nr:hypothetical protein [Candidatus Paceibacterota bacterium]MBT4651959.1 hypothetical protein [Candidatus Paceibacterota bacterium]MBT6755981.1 hypothetical protein [Candidatus Paceibacterota bacterium]MBT6921407.1 hypothetical protein [Candidatus Paceibacterota bacterium]
MKSNESSLSFTTSYKGITNVLANDIGVSQAFDPSLEKNPKLPIISAKAIWDTGATTSMITKALAKKLKLKPISKTTVNGVNHSSLEDTYLVNVFLPNKVLIHHVRTPQCDKLSGGFDFLIGMDVISSGDLSISHAGGKTKMSFRFPSLGGIDYVVESRKETARRKILSKVNRSSPSKGTRLKGKEKRKKQKLKKKKN